MLGDHRVTRWYLDHRVTRRYFGSQSCTEIFWVHRVSRRYFGFTEFHGVHTEYHRVFYKKKVHRVSRSTHRVPQSFFTKKGSQSFTEYTQSTTEFFLEDRVTWRYRKFLDHRVTRGYSRSNTEFF